MSSATTKATVDVSKLENLGDKIRARTGCNCLLTVEDMADKIGDISWVKTQHDYYGNNVCMDFDSFSTIDITYNYSDFQPVEYIEATGTQYINTGFSPNNNTDIEVDVLFLSIVGGDNSNYTHILASRYPSLSLAPNKGNFMQFEKSPTSSNLSNNQTNGVNLFERHKFSIKNGKDYVDDVEVSSHNKTIDQSTRPLYIFACNDEGTPRVRSQDVRLYGCKIWENSELVRDFIPCYHKIIAVKGLFDVIENKFYANSGTGDFIKGNDIMEV